MKNSGIYITEDTIRYGQITKHAKNRIVIKEQSLDISSLDEDKVSSSLKAFFQKCRISSGRFTLSIPRNLVSIKYLTLPSVQDQELKEMVANELDNLFPCKPQELVYDHTIISKEPDGYSKIMLVAAQRDLILKQLSLLQRAGLRPDKVTISTTALFNQFLEQARPPARYLLIYCEAESLEILYIDHDKVSFSRGVSFPHSSPLNDWTHTIGQTVTVLKDTGNLIDKVILTGTRSDLADFIAPLEKHSGEPIEIDMEIGVLKGLCYQGENETFAINLLPEDFKTQTKTEQKTNTLIVFGVVALLNLSLIAHLVFLKKKAREEYLHILNNEIKRIETPAAELHKKLVNIQRLQHYLSSGRLTLNLLTEVYRLAPEGILLDSLDITTQKNVRTLVLTGEAPDSKLVLRYANALKISPLIKRADVIYINKRTTETEQVADFEINARF